MDNENGRTDHDLLIELNTKVTLWHQELMRMITDTVKENAKELGNIDLKVSAAHKRMDHFDHELKNFGSLKDKVLGGAAVLMFIFSSIVSVIALLKP